VGDPVIVIAYAQMTPEEARRHQPAIVLLNPDNTIRERLSPERAAELAALSDVLDA
jgi:aspartate 1-decarboxylase